MAKTDFQSIDEYIAACPEQSQPYLQTIRATVKTIVPDAKEKISYQIAAFELNGKNLIHYAGWKNHVSMYPIPAGGKAFTKQTEKYATGKGTVQFPLDKPLPMKLIGQMIRLHLAAHKKRTKQFSKR
ncbi:MAG: DUF1801 domain-containing protein [Anaerolineales bacterium]|nr:DUF1801 domain-containing protein [Anaerolineales bacterium]